MKKILLIFVLLMTIIFGCTKGQNKNNMERNNGIIILKDSLWIKHKLWQKANLYKEFYISEAEAQSIEFIEIPVYCLNEKINDFNYGLGFKDYIIKDNTRVAGFLLKNNQLIGYIYGFLKNDVWKSGPVEIFTENSPLKHAYNLVETINKDKIYTLSPIGGLWYNDENKTMVYDSFEQKFINSDDFIKERVTIPELKRYYKDLDKFK